MVDIITASVDFSWELNARLEPWHYYRVVSQSVPRVAPPLTDCSDEPEHLGRYLLIVLARNESEVAQKLMDSGWVFSIDTVCRHDPSAIPNQYTNMRTMVDVTDAFLRAAEAIDFFLQQDLTIEGTGAMVVDESPTEEFEFEPEGGLVTSGTSPISVTFNPSTFFIYEPLGGLVIGGRADQAQTRWRHVASGGLILSSTTSFHHASVLGLGLILTLGGHSSATIVGTEEVEAKTKSSTTTDASAFYSSIDADSIESPALENVETECCPGSGTPTLLSLVHNLALAQNLSQFVQRHNLSVPNNLNMVYSTVTELWRGNLVLKSAVSGIEQQWQITFEFGCVYEAFGATDLHPEDALWKFAMNAIYRDGITNERYLTRLLLYFDREEVCTPRANLRFSFRFDPRTGQANPVTILDPVFVDGAGLYKSKFWVDNPTNPTLNFTVFAYPGGENTWYAYPELKKPILSPRAAPPLGVPEGFEVVTPPV